MFDYFTWCKIISVCWVTWLAITHMEVTYIRWSVYIRGIVLLLCLSEAIWQVESGRCLSDWNLLTSGLGKGLNCLLRQKYHLRYACFIMFNWRLPIFKWFWSIFGFVKFDFGFSMCFYLVSLNHLKIPLLFS